MPFAESPSAGTSGLVSEPSASYRNFRPRTATLGLAGTTGLVSERPASYCNMQNVPFKFEAL